MQGQLNRHKVIIVPLQIRVGQFPCAVICLDLCLRNHVAQPKTASFAPIAKMSCHDECQRSPHSFESFAHELFTFPIHLLTFVSEGQVLRWQWPPINDVLNARATSINSIRNDGYTSNAFSVLVRNNRMTRFVDRDSLGRRWQGDWSPNSGDRFGL